MINDIQDLSQVFNITCMHHATLKRLLIKGVGQVCLMLVQTSDYTVYVHQQLPSGSVLNEEFLGPGYHLSLLSVFLWLDMLNDKFK